MSDGFTLRRPSAKQAIRNARSRELTGLAIEGDFVSSDESPHSSSSSERSSTSPVNDSEERSHDTSTSTDASSIVDETLAAHLKLVNIKSDTRNTNHEVTTAPLFIEAVRAANDANTTASSTFTQWGFLGADVHGLDAMKTYSYTVKRDPRVFCNVAAPLSVFICGSQGSGKSHTLSVFLENYLVQSVTNQLPRPLTGIVFYYDSLTSEFSGSPCEASYLSSNPNISVRVLCSRTNISNIKVSTTPISPSSLRR
jgi:hypothetical protein